MKVLDISWGEIKIVMQDKFFLLSYLVAYVQIVKVYQIYLAE